MIDKKGYIFAVLEGKKNDPENVLMQEIEKIVFQDKQQNQGNQECKAQPKNPQKARPQSEQEVKDLLEQFQLD